VRVLVVEDHQDTREILSAFCRAEGCEVSEASDGDVGAQLFEEAEREGRPFRLVVLDLAMPKVDGASAAKRMREAEKTRRAWIEGCTGYERHVLSVETFYRAGIDHLSSKPVDPVEWQRLIRGLIAGSGELKG
jgi:CheY-like chemotaxis protein